MMLSHLSRCAILLAAIAVTSGCQLNHWVHNGFKVGPNYCQPAAPVSGEWMDVYDERVQQDLPANEDWWYVFHDEQMTRLVYTAYQQNLTLQEAGLRVLQARALRGVAVGGIFPQSQAGFGEFSHNQLSRNAFGGPPAGAVRAFDDWSAGFDMAWELDVWGKFRRNIEAADADLNASIEGYDGILVTLLAETAATYVDYRTLQQRLAYARQNVVIQKESLQVAVDRFEGRLTSELDVAQAKAVLAQTRELIPQLESQLRIANNQLCVLLGTPPVNLDFELHDGPIPTAPPTVAVGVPADLLRRRPDVRSAERAAAAQSARIGVATADLYPHFSIAGAIQYEAQDLSNLFRGTSLAGSVAPGLRWDILNYNRLVNNIRAQDALFQQTAVAYQQTVLSANAEAENAINSFLQSQEQLIHSREAAEAAKRSVELAATQYRQGAIDFINVFTLMQNLVQQQESLAVAQGAVANNLIAIYKALGGGWQIRYDGFATAANFAPADGPAEPAPGSIPLDPPPEPDGPPPAAPDPAAPAVPPNPDP